MVLPQAVKQVYTLGHWTLCVLCVGATLWKGYIPVCHVACCAALSHGPVLLHLTAGAGEQAQDWQVLNGPVAALIVAQLNYICLHKPFQHGDQIRSAGLLSAAWLVSRGSGWHENSVPNCNNHRLGKWQPHTHDERWQKITALHNFPWLDHLETLNSHIQVLTLSTRAPPLFLEDAW